MTKILMCSPDYFEVSYDINPWMTKQIGQVNRDLAQIQWYKLYTALKEHATVDLISAEPGLPDMVFTANAGTVVKNKVVLSRFAKEPRRGEETRFAHYFYEREYTVHQPDEYYEGEGDHLIDSRGRHWLGYGFRTEKIAVHGVEKYLDLAIMPIGLVDSRWYHLDTAFCPLPGGELMWHSAAFSMKAQNIIQQAFPVRFDVSETDALRFACNCVCIGRHLFMPAGTVIAGVLRDLDYRVHEFNLSEFIKSGGAAKCLTLLLEH